MNQRAAEWIKSMRKDYGQPHCGVLMIVLHLEETKARTRVEFSHIWLESMDEEKWEGLGKVCEEMLGTAGLFAAVLSLDGSGAHVYSEKPNPPDFLREMVDEYVMESVGKRMRLN